MAVVSAKIGRALACTTVVPEATPVTDTPIDVALAGITTVAGTVAIAGLSTLMLIVKPLAGAGDESVSVSWCLVFAAMVRGDGERVRLPVTDTIWLEDVNPFADAVMVAVPNATPVNCGGREGVVEPAGMRIFVGFTVTTDGLLLLSDTNVPLTDGVARVTWK